MGILHGLGPLWHRSINVSDWGTVCEILEHRETTRAHARAERSGAQNRIGSRRIPHLEGN
jgi:hypothetical protein